MHGFDEFFGNLHHLNAEEEPEQRTYPRDLAFRETFGPRGVLKCKATDTDDPTVEEGAFRVPCMIRWPGKIQAAQISNEIISGLDRMPTLLAAAGDPDITDKLLKGCTAAGKPSKFISTATTSFPISSRSSERRALGGFGASRSPPCACPKLFDLRADPFERADVTLNTYYDWFISQPYLIMVAQTEVAKFLRTFSLTASVIGNS